MSKKIFLLVGIFLLLISGNVMAGPEMKEGLWEITTSMEMQGMPIKMPQQTYTHCLTKKDMVPQKAEPGQECKKIKYDVKGNTVSWVMECTTPDGTITSNGKVTYKGNSFEGLVKVSMPGGKRGGMEMTQKLSGKLIGQCK